MHIDLELTKEQKLLQDSTRRYLEENIAPLVDEMEKRGPMKKEEAHRLIKKLIPYGFMTGRFPDEMGGLGLSALDGALISLELIKVWMSLSGIVGISAGAAAQVAYSDNDLVKERCLDGLMTGDLIGCFGLSEPDAGSDPSSIRTTAVLDGDHYVVNGTKFWISNGSIADICILNCKQADGRGNTGPIMQLVVDRRQSPWEARDPHKLGFRAFPTSELYFDNCRVPRGHLLQPPGKGFAAAQRSLIAARYGAALASVGLAEAALEHAIQYARQRVQFGKPIGGHQMVQQLIAEMIIEVDAARLLTFSGYSHLDRGMLTQRDSSVAKAYATEAAVRVTSKAIQIHGAYGITEDLPLERYFRDARMLTIPDGTTQIQYLLIARDALGIDAIR
jgi:alkylation response protein AidB-like acyl-CoA dehydrogenase